MNKKLLSVAIGAALTLPVIAQADVTVYGKAQVEVAGTKIDATSAAGVKTEGKGKTNVTDQNQGTLGVKASEDLGGGLSAIAKFEFVVNTAGDSSTGSGANLQNTTTQVNGADTGQAQTVNIGRGDREDFVGLESKSLGTLRLGRMNSPYKLTGVALDPFVATTLQARGNGGMSAGDAALNGHSSGYVNNGIVYNSPKFAGIGIDVYASPDNTDNTQGDVSLGLTAAFGPVSLFVVRNTDKNANGSTVGNKGYDATATKFGGKVALGGAGNIVFQLESIDTGATGAGNATDYTFVGYNISIGSLMPVVELGTKSVDVDATNAGGSEKDTSLLVLGVRYNLSKNTSLFGGLRTTNRENRDGSKSDTTVHTAGLRMDF